MKVNNISLNQLDKKREIRNPRLFEQVLYLLNEKKLEHDEIISLFSSKKRKRQVREILFIINSYQSTLMVFIGGK